MQSRSSYLIRERGELLEKLTPAENLDELKGGLEKLNELITLAKEAKKLGKNREKLLIFTESKNTLEYLVKNPRN